MQYDSRQDYVADCILAAVGTYFNEDYLTRNFEDVIGNSSIEQSVCSRFISFVKTVSNKQYVTQTNFYDYLQSKAISQEGILDREQELSKLIFELLQNENTKSTLKDPKELFTRLLEARRKINLENSITSLKESDEFSEDAVTWSKDYFDKVQKTLESVEEDSSLDEEDEIYFGEDLTKYYQEKIENRKNGETYSFHNKIFDELVTEGPTPGHGGIIGGSTGMGKSALCLNVINDLINADVPCMYLPIEMGMENTLDRLVSIRTGYPFKEIVRIGKTQETNTELEKQILYEIKSLSVHPNFAIVNKANINMKTLKMYIKRFQAKLPGNKYCIVFIDLLLMIQDFYDNGTGNMATAIERAINKLDILAKELGIHWVGVVQLNRSVESDKVLSEQSINKLRPTRASIKNSAALLERARWAITVFRKKYFADLYLSEEEAAGIDDIAEIQLMKANDESISRRFATFDGPTFKITLNEDYGKSANGF